MKNIKSSFALLFKWIFRSILLILLVYYSFLKTDNNSNYISNILLILITSFIPDIILNIFKVKLSSLPDFLLQFFIFLALLLGRMYNMYSILPWWDIFLHFTSGALLGFLSLIILKPLIGENNIKTLPPLFGSVNFFTLLLKFSLYISRVTEFFCIKKQ